MHNIGGEEVDKQTISQKLKACRGEKSREEVARSLGISTSALRMYETAERIPRDEIKIALARYYSTTVQSLFFDDTPTPPR